MNIWRKSILDGKASTEAPNWKGAWPACGTSLPVELEQDGGGVEKVVGGRQGGGREQRWVLCGTMVMTD